MSGAVFMCALLFAASAMAESLQGKATAITGDRVHVAGAEAEIVLAGILAPRGRTEPLRAPLADDAREALAGLLADHTVSVRPVTAGADRAGRLHAQLLRDDGLRIEPELLRKGFV